MLVELSGYFIDRAGNLYFLILERAKDLGDGTYLITREIPIIVWEPIQ